MNSSFSAKAWCNGSPRPSGAGYGLKLTAQDRDTFLRRDQKTITLYLEGEDEPIEVVTGKASMWDGTCRELLKKEIGLWLLKAKLAPWAKGHPPSIVLLQRSPGVFQAQLP